MTAPWMIDAPAWMRHGICHGENPELFYPNNRWPAVAERDPSGRAVTMFNPAVTEAKRICGNCPVRVDCLNHALDTNEDHGVWGGTTPKERRPLRKARKALLEGDYQEAA